jgi:hypothetical protein
MNKNYDQPEMHMQAQTNRSKLQVKTKQITAFAFPANDKLIIHFYP